MVGDGFGGRLWYQPSNYSVGSYSAYTICGDSCGNNNQLYSWGFNGNGELGVDTISYEGTVSPNAVPGMTNVRYYTCGYSTAVIKNDKTGWVWGSLLPLHPVQVISDVSFVDAGEVECTFVKSDGSVWSVGNNRNGTFGNGGITSTTHVTTNPVRMNGITNAVRVAVGYYNNFILLADGTVMATGINLSGGLGIGVPPDSIALSPVPIPSLSHIVDVKANSLTAIALTENGDVYTWGDGFRGCIGDGTYDDGYVPKKIKILKNIVAISGCDDGAFFLALDSSHNCYGWGWNQQGQLGIHSSFDTILTPVLVATDVKDIMAGETFSYIVKTDGSLWATGSTTYLSIYQGSIWMNLPNNQHHGFLSLNPTIAPMNLCKPYIPFTSFAVSTDAGCSEGMLTITHIGGIAPYTYSIGAGSQSANIFRGLPPGNYTVTVTDSVGCTSSVLTTIHSTGNTASYKSLIDTICNGQTYNFNGRQLITSGIYHDTLLNSVQCDSIITLNLTIHCNDDCDYFIPTAFSPNGDGVNDEFKIRSQCAFSGLFIIYDRLGNEVFKTTDLTINWNGKYKGENLPVDVYAYYFEFTQNGKTEKRKGNITLLR